MGEMDRMPEQQPACRCGVSLLHVPEHLLGLAVWVCQECAAPVPCGVRIRYKNGRVSAAGACRRR